MISLLAPHSFGKKLDRFRPILYRHLEDRIYLRFWDVIIVRNEDEASMARKFEKFGTRIVNAGEKRIDGILNFQTQEIDLFLEIISSGIKDRKRSEELERTQRLLMEPLNMSPKMFRAYSKLGKLSHSRVSLVVAEDGLLENWILSNVLGRHDVIDFGVMAEEEALLRIFGTNNHPAFLTKEGVLVLMNCDNCSEKTISKVSRTASVGTFVPYMSESSERCMATVVFHFKDEDNIPKGLLQIAGTGRVEIPPLRKITDDLPGIFRFLVSNMGQNLSAVNLALYDDISNELKKSDWQENWREFLRLCKSFVSGEAKFDKNLENTKKLPSLKKYTKMIVSEGERELIRKAIQIHGMDRKKLCEVLGINTKTLSKKLKLYGFEKIPKMTTTSSRIRNDRKEEHRRQG